MITLVLLPGLDGTGRLFAGFARAMGGTCRVVAYPPDRALDYAALTDLVHAQLPRDEPFVLLGESFSGPVAVALAARRPPGLQALVLACSFVASPMPAPVNVVRHLTPWLPLKPTPAFLLSRLLHGRFHAPAAQHELAGVMDVVTEPALRARLRALLGVDQRHALQAVTVPVLYLQARQDRLVWRRCARLVRRHHPSTKIVTLDGPHFLLQTRPEQAATAIREFLHREGIAVGASHPRP